MSSRKHDNVCGTYAGYMRHRTRGEAQCDDCRRANAEYERRRSPRDRSHRFETESPEAAERRKERVRAYNAALQRARARLAREYPERHAELLAEERRSA